MAFILFDLNKQTCYIHEVSGRTFCSSKSTTCFELQSQTNGERIRESEHAREREREREREKDRQREREGGRERERGNYTERRGQRERENERREIYREKGTDREKEIITSGALDIIEFGATRMK